MSNSQGRMAMMLFFWRHFENARKIVSNQQDICIKDQTMLQFQ